MNNLLVPDQSGHYTYTVPTSKIFLVLVFGIVNFILRNL